MDVVRERFDDRSEPDDRGMYEYQYTGTYYTFKQGEEELIFACYDDMPAAALLKRPIEWRPDIYECELFRLAIEYLRTNATAETIKLLDPSYPGKGFIPMSEAVKAARSAGLRVPRFSDGLRLAGPRWLPTNSGGGEEGRDRCRLTTRSSRLGGLQ